jgi:hypothetical protein
MDVGRAGKFSISRRSVLLVGALFTFLLVSLFWNIRQSRHIEQDRLRSLAREQEAADRAKAAADQNQARLNKNADWAASDARVQQLYREIDGLSQINEHILTQRPRQGGAPEKISHVLDTDDKP